MSVGLSVTVLGGAAVVASGGWFGFRDPSPEVDRRAGFGLQLSLHGAKARVFDLSPRLVCGRLRTVVVTSLGVAIVATDSHVQVAALLL